MIVRGFKSVAWVGAIGTAALGCYMLSLQVASERADLAGIERRIVFTQQEIRSIQTELGTRARLQQLEHWNAEVLALSAPIAGQFLESNVSLARFDVRQRGLEDPREVRMAAAEATPAAPLRNPAPAVQLASAEMAAKPAVPQPTRPLVRRATLAAAPAPQLVLDAAGAQPRAPQLLDSRTLAALRNESRSERDGGTRN